MIPSEALIVGGFVRAAIVGAIALAFVGCREDPFDFGQPRSCELADQNAWVEQLMFEAYLWNDQLVDVDPDRYETPSDVITAMRVDPDRWSRVSDRVRTDALFQEGKTVGLGFRTERNDADEVVVAWVTPDSPAAQADLRRSDVLRAVAGVSVPEIDADDRWKELYGENEPGVSVRISVQRPGEAPREVELTKDWITINTVPVVDVLDGERGPVGYFVFSGFVDTSTDRLDEAFLRFKKRGVRDVIVDLRYNSGGRVRVARHLVDLLVGDLGNGNTGYKVRYGAGLDDEDDDHLIRRADNSLRDPRSIVFITTGDTLSASELVINATRPYIDTQIVGAVTGGKPVGSHQWDFCDKIAQPVTFELLNAEDQGGYFDGLPPNCAAPDDLTHALGDPEETSLAQALHVIATGVCMDLPTAEPDDEAGPTRLPPQVHVDEEMLRGVF